MKYTLLELTQAVLSSMDSDEINSINDSVESQQVVEVIKTVYDDIVSRGDVQRNKTLFNLDASATVSKPIVMTKPSTIERIEWIKYDCRDKDDTAPVWNELTYLPQVDFIDYIHTFDQTDTTNVSTFSHTADGFTTTFAYQKKSPPRYYTSFNDNTIFFDGYDSEVESTLQSSKTLCYGIKTSDFQRLDTYVPELQPQQFALLLNEAKSLAWAELKQTEHGKAEQMARRNWRHLQKNRQQVPNSNNIADNSHSFSKLPNFARNR